MPIVANRYLNSYADMVAAIRAIQIDAGRPVSLAIDNQSIGQQIVLLQQYGAAQGWYDPAKVRRYIADSALAEELVTVQLAYLAGGGQWVATEAALKAQYASASALTPHSQSALGLSAAATGAGSGTAPPAPYAALTNAYRYTNGTTSIFWTGGGEAVTGVTYRRTPVATHGASGGNIDTTLDGIIARDYAMVDAQIVAYRVLGGDAVNGFRLIVGTQYASLTPTIVSTGGRQYIVWDLGSKALRLLALERPLNLAIDGIHVGVGDTVSYPGAINQNICVFFGDSFVAANVAGNNGDGYTTIMGENLGFYNIASSGVGGTGVVATNGGSSPNYGQRIVADINRMKAQGTITKLVIQPSINDIGLSGIQAAASSLLDVARSLLPAASITLNGLADVNAPSASVAGYDACEGAWQAAAAGRGGVHYFSKKGLPYAKADLTHPNAPGHATIAANDTAAEKAIFGL